MYLLVSKYINRYNEENTLNLLELINENKIAKNLC